MENKSNVAAISAQKFITVEGKIEGPETAESGKQFMRIMLELSDMDDDGYSGQSRAYGKALFEDSHSLQYQKALIAQEKNLPMKIKGAKIFKDLLNQDGSKRYYYLVEEVKGKTVHRKNQDGEDIVSNRLASFFLADENPEVYFNNQIKKITKAGLWVETPEEGEPNIE